MPKPIRFGYAITDVDASDAVALAQRAESIGFDTVVVTDHVGTGPAPALVLAAMAQATETIRLGTFVLNNDMRNPVQLAWEAATLDRLSQGRFELGLGAGHNPNEYAATGVTFDHPRRRKERLAESVEIIRQLVDGQRVDYAGRHHQVEAAEIEPAHQEHLPILVGGNGTALLTHAARHADIIGLQGLGRTLPDGLRHSVKWSPDRVTSQIDVVRKAAPGWSDRLELNALVQIVEVTENREQALESICERADGLRLEDAAATPYLMVGTVPGIVEHILQCHERWGINYFVVRELDGFTPIIETLRN